DLYGDIGNDKLYGDSGHDYLHGGRGGYPRPSSFEPLSVDFGSDELHGGDGKDRLWGQSGNDVLHGGRGVDYLIGGAVMSPLRHAPQLQILRHAFTQRLRVAGGVTV
ncbi:MAG: calcium-binding protein, partial [Fuerstiella sp.]